MVPQDMARILGLMTDLPYFPGKNGHDHFNFRFLSRGNEVGIVAPCYDWFPRQGVENLERFLTGGGYFWPRPVPTMPLLVGEELHGQLPDWLRWVPVRVRERLLRRLLGIGGRPNDAHEKLAILSNCAPQLLAALACRHWQALVLIQTNIEPWLDYLPAMGGKLVYFHDVRADYLERAGPSKGIRTGAGQIKAIREQEQQVARRADVVGFVSDLDLQRARRMFRIPAVAGVAPIPVDTDYYHPRPPDRTREPRPIVLFTGHLSHPPNVDATHYFLSEIWPRILEREPNAVFQAVGLMPDPALAERIAKTPSAELHANVPDIRPYFWDATVYVVPMRFGGGVRQKLFEAWSMKVPVVCTTMAAEGTGAANGEHCWLEDSPVAFAGRVVELLKGAEPAALLCAAKAFVESHNSIASAAPRFETLVRRAVAVKRQRPLKVLFDLRWMEIGKAGGIEQATYELISTIGRMDLQNEYRIYGPRSTCSEWRLPRDARVRFDYSDVAERQVDMLRAFVANRLAAGMGKPAVLSTPMRTLRKYNRLDFDLVHSVAGYIHPDLIGFPGVLTINDLQHLHYPEFFTPQEYEERERLYRASAEAARHIICISEFTRHDVHRQYGIPLEKMTTVWIIPSRTVWDRMEPGKVAETLATMGITGRFLLYPAHCWPHKNHDRLVEALQLVDAELPPDVKLVLTGRPFPPDHPAALRAREWGGGRRVVHLGFRSPLEIRALIQGCTALIFPSLFEGFGMPVAEAIIAGRPVLCSDVTSLPEIAGDAALTFDPKDAADIARTILMLMRDPAQEARLQAAAVDRRRVFSARRTAIQTMSVYHRVYEDLYGGQT